ncbi:hypothetical protein BDP27DRAFT_1413436 [Rhodocollybia butyracea]|uniref:Uncharacterized protein n=1 Tax=Rhodocollybia butyracea TaxID=206335 RepID=A0A9P5Q3J6_9AGAR|nr:hypothetical protein BDP27DRAFT_1413436 [Rhodocollybia butyracea]
MHRRIPFKFNEDPQDDATILDDQEQQEVLDTLRKDNINSNKQLIRLTQCLVTLSTILFLVYFVSPIRSQDSINSEIIPLPRPFTLLSLILHANLLLLLDSNSIRNILLRFRIELNSNTDLGLYTLGPTLSYSLALVAPTVCIFLRRSWLTISWWSITAVVTYTVQTVLESIASGNERISSLEAMRYVAPGA